MVENQKNERMKALVVSQIHLKKVHVQAYFMSRKGDMRGAVFVKLKQHAEIL